MAAEGKIIYLPVVMRPQKEVACYIHQQNTKPAPPTVTNSNPPRAFTNFILNYQDALGRRDTVMRVASVVAKFILI